MFRDFILDHLPDGWPSHVMGWLFSGDSDIVYQNPNFNSEDYTEESSVAIYCIHGTGDKVASFRKVAQGILPELPPIVSSIHLLSFAGRWQGKSIPFFANQVLEKIVANQHRNVIVMGHSRGAKVAAYFAEELAAAAEIEVISAKLIAGPLKGSHLALPPLALLSDSVRQMALNSEFSQSLAAKIKKSKVRYCFYAANDDLIVRPQNAQLEMPCYSRELFMGEGHVSIMSSQALIHVIGNDIRRACRDYLHIPENRTESPAYLMEAFHEIKREEVTAPLYEVCYELECWIETLLKTLHLQSASNKLLVLVKLKDFLETKDYQLYPQARTLGELIQAFLHDPLRGDGHRLPAEILAESLNYPLSAAQALFHPDRKAKTEDKIAEIINKYGSTLLQADSVSRPQVSL